MDSTNYTSKQSDEQTPLKLQQQQKQPNQTNQLWFNEDQGKYFLIDGSGKKIKCNNSGQLLPKYNPQLTGYASFNKRSEVLQRIQQEKGKNQDENVISPNKSLKFLHEPPKNTYLPALNKFEGYVQFRCPVVKNSKQFESVVLKQQQTANILSSLTQEQHGRNLRKSRQSHIYQSLPSIIDNNSKDQINNQVNDEYQQQLPVIVIDQHDKSNSPRRKTFEKQKRKNSISSLYKSYKSNSKPTEYFQQNKVFKNYQDNSFKVLNSYANYLSLTSLQNKKNRYRKNSSESYTDSRSIRNKIKESALNQINDKSIGSMNQAKIAELSLKIISYQELQEDLREPPHAMKILNDKSTNNIQKPKLFGSINSRLGMPSRENSISQIQKTSDLKLQSSSSIQNMPSIYSSQKLMGTLNTYTSQDLTTISPIQINEYRDQNYDSRGSRGMRFKSYAEMKNDQIMAQTINNYQQLKIRDKDKISAFMSSSPRQEFEKEQQYNDNQKILLQDDQESQGQFHKTLQRDNSSLGRSVSPRVKSVMDFNNPFMLTNFPDPKEAQQQHLQELISKKKRTSGLFNESIVQIGDPGDHWRKDRMQILKANPHAMMILKKQDEFENKKAHKKKHQKKLQAMALEQDMKIEDRKIYKKFIKY